MKSFVMLISLLFLGGCAMGHTTSYQGQSKFKPNYKMPPVYLGVIEQRPYIIDGSKSPTYTGTLRSIGGVPYNINTKSGLPVTVVLQGLVKRTLASQVLQFTT